MLSKFRISWFAALLAVGGVNFYPTNAMSAGSGYNVITELAVHHNGTQHVIVKIGTASPLTDRPGCHQAWWDRHFIFDVGTNKGKAMYSLLTAAYLAGKKVQVTGANSCTTTGADVIETLATVRLY